MCGRPSMQERETGGLTWNSSVKDIDSAGEATAVDLQSEPETLLRLAEGASHKVTLIENSNTQLPLQGELTGILPEMQSGC